MKLIILAAGEGKRLRPYTNEIPKCMVELGGKSLLSYQLSSMMKQNISKDDIALVGGYKIEALESFDLKIFKNLKYKITNMVTTLFCAREFISKDEDLIISYGDIIYEDIVLKSLISCQEEICVVADKNWERLWRLRMVNPLEDAETFIMDNNYLIRDLGKKLTSFSQAQAQYIGLVKIRGNMISKFLEIYDQMNQSAFYDGKKFDEMYMTSFLQYLIDLGWKAKAVLISNGWLEVDTASDLVCYNQMVKDNSLESYCKI